MAGINITLGGNFAALNTLQSRISETAAKIRTGFAERVGHRMFDGLISGARQIPGVIQGAIEAASDLGETVSKVGVVFQEQSDAMISWAQNSATAIGQSKTEALSAAATYGNLFVAMGMTGDQSAVMSRRLVELAADLASFNNTEVPDAIESIGAALRGEAEPIRKYGVLLNDATLKAEALAQGLSDGKSTLDPATRALAAYSVILSQTGTAQGDFARTSDGLANSQRILSAQLKDSVTAIGEGMLPVMEKLAAAAKQTDFEFIGESIGGGISDGAEMLMDTLGLLEGVADKFRFIDLGFTAKALGSVGSIADSAKISGGLKRNEAATTEFDPRAISSSATSREDIEAKLDELEARKESLIAAAQAAMADGSDGLRDSMQRSLDGTLDLLDRYAARISGITDQQLAANQSKRDAAAAEAAHAEEIKKSEEAYKKAQETFAKATAEAEKKRVEALPIAEQIDALNEAEAKIRESFNVGIQNLQPGASASEIVANMERLRDLGNKGSTDGETLRLAGELLTIEEKRAALLAEQAKTQEEAEKLRTSAVSDYDAELALIRAQVEGDKEKVAQLEREAAVRQKIADLVAAGIDPGEAANRAEVIASAQDELTLANKRREAEEAISKAERIAAGMPDVPSTNEDYLNRISDLRSQFDNLGFQSGLTAVDSMQRIGGGGGFAGSDGTLDFARRQTELQREMVSQLAELNGKIGKEDME